MKKIKLYIFILLFCLMICSCSSIKEYKGTAITKLTYTTIDYMGGYTNINVIDFTTNEYLNVGYLPVDEEVQSLEVKKTFTDEEEKTFIDSCYTYGLFNIKSLYENNNVIDGGGWNLEIEYADGTKKISKGSNAGPDRVFDNCATVFYDLCGRRILGTLPEYYDTPPSIDVSTIYKSGDLVLGSYNGFHRVCQANYKWNKFEVTNKDIYAINLGNMDNLYLKDYEYELSLFTDNYHCKTKFNKFTLKSYDFNEELTNEKIVCEDNWFNQIKIKLELNKIYVFELGYKNGDFVQYTFNTLAKEQKVLYGLYKYNIYNEGACDLIIKEDMTYELKPFKYFNNELNILNESEIGEYKFETIDNQEYLVLYASNNQKIILEYSCMMLKINFELSNFDFNKFNLELKNSDLNIVSFNYYSK